jgi:ribonuclease E
MPTRNLNPQIINAAILGFEEQKRHIDTQIAELRAILPGGRAEPVATPEAPKVKRRKLSAAARKRIGDAQRKRWSESKPPSEPTSQLAAPPEAPKRKRKLSAAGKRAIVEATKKRWAAFHAVKAAEQQVVAKKGAGKKTAAKKVTAKKTAVTMVAKKVAKTSEAAPSSAA